MRKNNVKMLKMEHFPFKCYLLLYAAAPLSIRSDHAELATFILTTNE